MGIVKTTKSGKGVQFITDEGEVYMTSLRALSAMIYKNNPLDFMVLTKMPLGVSPDRFPKSKLFTKEGLVDVSKGKQKTTSNDVFSGKGKKANEEKEAFKDKKVW